MCIFVGLTDFVKRSVLTLVDEKPRYRNYHFYYYYYYCEIIKLKIAAKLLSLEEDDDAPASPIAHGPVREAKPFRTVRVSGVTLLVRSALSFLSQVNCPHNRQWAL